MFLNERNKMNSCGCYFYLFRHEITPNSLWEWDKSHLLQQRRLRWVPGWTPMRVPARLHWGMVSLIRALQESSMWFYVSQRKPSTLLHQMQSLLIRSCPCLRTICDLLKTQANLRCIYQAEGEVKGRKITSSVAFIRLSKGSMSPKWVQSRSLT